MHVCKCSLGFNPYMKRQILSASPLRMVVDRFDCAFDFGKAIYFGKDDIGKTCGGTFADGCRIFLEKSARQIMYANADTTEVIGIAIDECCNLLRVRFFV